MRLILASTSEYRRALLQRLQVPFEACAPDIDEAPLSGESPPRTARRLAEAKANAVAMEFPDSLIIGCDQVAAMGEQRFGKPLNRANAIHQLRSMSGQTVRFHTGVCLLNTANRNIQHEVVGTEVNFRELSDAEIDRYLDREDALNCAGSAKSEALGISLMTAIRGDDPTALIGLPLIALCNMLRTEGVKLP